MSHIKLFIFVIVGGNGFANELDSSGYRIINRIFKQCDAENHVIRCLKLQTLKGLDRALRMDSLKLIDGITLVRDETARSLTVTNESLSEDKLHKLELSQIDGVLIETADKFLSSHKVQFDISKLVQEGRGKMKKYMMPMMAAMAIKGGLMAMAMKGIAAMAGTALMIGKMALMISAIMGLKKLLASSGGGQKTTVEIVKHPQMSFGNSVSTSYEDAGYGGGGYGNGGGGYGSASSSSSGGYSNGGGYGSSGASYHRSLSAKAVLAQEKAYRTHVPKSK